MSGAAVNLIEGDPWQATQEDLSPDYDYPGDGENIQRFDWSFGPVMNVGYLDLDTLEITVNPMYMGISAGTLTGNLRDGVKLNISYHLGKGTQHWYLKNGNQLWTHVDFSVSFNGSYQGAYKIFSL
ncbi:hypothetical protein N7468_009826 [Penicillium chermesinum]|uniref:Uncharacterized protein n=1 Tax=Penicillium chermesinum TaxID=63820 RepID=A0A9W9NDF1_9EURO|nr:uncharacterized protein N7468_009826 [Penicillium chermesinum]KAJ5216818.1 hypothetical protein N7468_009826 [Penicillium chermesinum]KAJ6171562.1 hypothetical protein N7470_000629 [Penicillium chermesinum]